MEIFISKPAGNVISQLDGATRERVFNAIYNPPANNTDMKYIMGAEGLFRLRVGDVRIIYRFEGDDVLILNAGVRGGESSDRLKDLIVREKP